MKELIFEIPDELLDHTAVVVPVKSGKELIRCKDCRYASHEPCDGYENCYVCNFSRWRRAEGGRMPYAYCSDAERKEE